MPPFAKFGAQPDGRDLIYHQRFWVEHHTILVSCRFGRDVFLQHIFAHFLRIAIERVYFDAATIARQLGVLGAA